MAKFIDLTRTVYGYEDVSPIDGDETTAFVCTGDILQAILSDDAQGWKRVHAIHETNVIDGDVEQALNRLRRWARKEGYAAPIRKSDIVKRRGGAFRR